MRITTIIDPTMEKQLGELNAQHAKAVLLMQKEDKVTERDLSAVIGPGGTGKSTLTRLWLEEHPPVIERTRKNIPILRINVPAQPTQSELYTKVLDALNFPQPEKLKLSERRRTVKQLLHACRVCTIVFNESNHFAERGDPQSVINAGNAMKLFLEENMLHGVFVGTEDTEKLFMKNEQLAGRVSNVIRLNKLECKTAAGMEHAKTFIYLAEQQLGFPEPSNLHNEDTVIKIVMATTGGKRRICKYLNNAADCAEREKMRRILPKHLSEAFSMVPRPPSVKKDPFL